MVITTPRWLFAGGFPRDGIAEVTRAAQTAIFHVQRNLELIQKRGIEGGNPTRIDSLDEAVALHRRLFALWSQHPRFTKFVPHEPSFLRMITAVLAVLGVVIARFDAGRSLTRYAAGNGNTAVPRCDRNRHGIEDVGRARRSGSSATRRIIPKIPRNIGDCMAVANVWRNSVTNASRPTTLCTVPERCICSSMGNHAKRKV